MACIFLICKFEGTMSASIDIYQFLIGRNSIDLQSIWAIEFVLLESFFEFQNSNYDFSTTLKVLQNHIFTNSNDLYYLNFVQNLVFFTFYEKGDEFSHIIIVLAATMIFMETY